jgi:nitroimidazol reductase NimA-like FMN-containing flavoprotein (pyridoxamine 5'-phosphate oxidase superfamily)
MPIDLSGYEEAINSALAENSVCVLATQGETTPNIGFKGSVQVFDGDHLSYWERTRGQHLANLHRNPGVAYCISAASVVSTCGYMGKPSCMKTDRCAIRSWPKRPRLS